MCWRSAKLRCNSFLTRLMLHRVNRWLVPQTRRLAKGWGFDFCQGEM